YEQQGFNSSLPKASAQLPILERSALKEVYTNSDKALIPQLFLQAFFKPVTESCRQLEGAAITHQADHVPRAIQNRRTVFTTFKVLFHPQAKLRIDGAVNIIRQLPPDFYATDFDYVQVTRASLSSNSRLECSTRRQFPGPARRAFAAVPAATASLRK